MPHDVFICCSSRDMATGEATRAALEAQGIRCWFGPRDILAGADWGKSIISGIDECRVLVLIFSATTNQSPQVDREVERAVSKGKFLVPVRIEDVAATGAIAYYLDRSQFVDAVTNPFDTSLSLVVETVRKLLPPEERSPDFIRAATPAAKAKGYVFISYNKMDLDFIEQLKVILKRRGYAYWDYSESERDYHSALYRELEEKIEAAAAFMCVVTDSWRETEWPAAEYIYAKEAKVPVFVIQAKKLSRPVPIIINQQTRIDMAIDFERGSAVLEHELDKKGL